MRDQVMVANATACGGRGRDGGTARGTAVASRPQAAGRPRLKEPRTQGWVEAASCSRPEGIRQK